MRVTAVPLGLRTMKQRLAQSGVMAIHRATPLLFSITSKTHPSWAMRWADSVPPTKHLMVVMIFAHHVVIQGTSSSMVKWLLIPVVQQKMRSVKPVSTTMVRGR